MTETVLDTIKELLHGAPPPSLDSVEAALTDGYAHALTLEGERLRLERRLRDLVRAPRPHSGERSSAIAELTQRVGAADVEVRELRARLAALRKHVYEPRTAAERASAA